MMKQFRDTVRILDFVLLKQDTWKDFSDLGTNLECVWECYVFATGWLAFMCLLQGLLSKWEADWKRM